MSQFDAKSMAEPSALNSARRKVYARALPLLFVCYIIAYIDRTNISVAQLTMSNTLTTFTKQVIGTGAAFSSWVLPARDTWHADRRTLECAEMDLPHYGHVGHRGRADGLCADSAAVLRYSILAGPGRSGFLSRCHRLFDALVPEEGPRASTIDFPDRLADCHDRGNYVSGLMLEIGEGSNPTWFGLKGWQIIFLFWGVPAVLLGFYVLLALTDRPHQATWLTVEEREALESQLAARKRSIKKLRICQCFRA